MNENTLRSIELSKRVILKGALLDADLQEFNLRVSDKKRSMITPSKCIKILKKLTSKRVFIATSRKQYDDQKEGTRVIILAASEIGAVREITNTQDCSYEWKIKEVN